MDEYKSCKLQLSNFIVTMAVPKQQKAILALAQYAPAIIQTIDVRSPGPNEVLVRVESTSLSPGDEKVKDYGSPFIEYPVLLGFEAAGVVVQLGEGVTNLGLGDRVVFQASVKIPLSSQYGGFQQYAITPADIAVKIPDHVNFDQASTVLGSFGTAILGLFGDYDPESPTGGAGLTPFWREEGKDKYKNQPILILSGATSVGQYAIQIARLAGFFPIITTASLHNTALLKSFGATHVIDRTLPRDQIISEIRNIVPDALPVIYDAFAIPETQKLGYDLLAPGGALVVALKPVLDREQARKENKKIAFTYGWLHIPPNDKIGMELLRDKIPEWLRSGDIKPNNVEVIPGGIDGVLVGLERLRNNQVSGKKLVVRPQETA
ncbi:GroES-like protein [Panus rudis PR-1116 ss-1]|nr:GroES-like protein [Panus rudis PR-1116 ss-1]